MNQHPQSIVWRAFSVAVIFSLLLASCASMPEKMQKRLAEGNLSETVSMGEEYLSRKPDAPDAGQVRDMVMGADFAIAKNLDTVNAYEDFERKYRHSPLAAEVTERKSKAYYGTVTVPAGTATACRDFRKLFPYSSLTKDSKELELKLAWKEAEQEKTTDGWRYYHEIYPDSPRAKEALENEIELAWKKAQQAETIEAFAEFAKAYPASSHCKEASERICEIAWQHAQKVGAVESFAAFVKEYPDSSHVKEALAKLCNNAWQQAVKEDTPEAYGKFSEGFPKCGAQVILAKEKECDTAWQRAMKENSV